MKVILFLGADAKYTLDFRKELMLEFKRRDYRVIVCATPLAEFDPSNFETLGIEFLPWVIRKAGLNVLEDFAAIRALRRILNETAPDILFMHTAKPVIYGSLAAWRLSIPRSVAMIPGLGHAFMPPKNLRHWVAKFAAHIGYRFAFNNASALIFHNDDDITELRALGILNDQAKTHRVFGSGVDVIRFANAPHPSGAPSFLMVARLLREKGVREFIDAARIVRKDLPDARFTLVGAPDANPSAITPLELDAWRTEGVVEIVGHVPDPQSHYASCNVFVLPSYREGTPRTNLEAMATGRAIITTDVPGCRETVEHGVNGLLVPPRDVEALAAAMLDLARSPDRVRAMGEAGRLICVERYELGKVTAETISLIEGNTPSRAYR